jgi:hypothetical protein
MKNDAMVEFEELPVDAQFEIDGTTFKKTSDRAAHIEHSPRQPQYNGIGPFLFGGIKPVRFISAQGTQVAA